MMHMQSKSFTLDFSGKTLTAEFTDLAAQTNGSVLLKLEETAVLVTATMSKRESPQSYFPLSVEFEEKFYAAGAIPGSRFQKREGQPSEAAILSARAIDRTIRPLFDHTIRRDIQVVVTVLAVGEDDPDILGIIGASLALGVSDIPWAGPVGAVRIGRRKHDGEILINPNYTDRADEQLSFEILTCGQDNTLGMIEAAGMEITEPDMVAVLDATVALHEHVVHWQRKIIAELGQEKIVFDQPKTPKQVAQLFETQFKQTLEEVIFSSRPGKDHIYELKHVFVETASELEVEVVVAGEYFETQIDKILHDGAIKHQKRADGRALDTVQPLFAKAGGISPVLHGSGIFYRGGTHIFSALTLGSPDAAQQLDTMEDRDTKKRFLHHYNFPPHSVGETGRVGEFSRRVIGNGTLVEKALRPVIPTQEQFPYTIGLVLETLASNGSSSMGSVCAATLALMDGGVPIKRPVAGIALGVMIEGDKHAVLTDIQGPENEFGDMDLKVAGTTVGITAIQMDVKMTGIPIHILREAIDQARVARLQILETIQAELAAPRPDISDRAPHTLTKPKKSAIQRQ